MAIDGVNLTKAYHLGDEPVYALRNVSLGISAGDMVALHGRDGAGKSTLLHILGCLQRPDSGQLHIDGLDVTRLEDTELAKVRLHKVGFLFQAFNLLPNETALANVEVLMQHRGLKDGVRRRKAEEALEFVGLENRLEHKPGQLSAMQRQCVAIARALVHEPTVILADEPARVLDDASREEVMGLFQKLNDAGMTIVISTTHDSVSSYCQPVIRMVRGRMVDNTKVSKRRLVPDSRVPGTSDGRYACVEETVCPRCSLGNPKGEEKRLRQ